MEIRLKPVERWLVHCSMIARVCLLIQMLHLLFADEFDPALSGGDTERQL
jgi:hypothetical protein